MGPLKPDMQRSPHLGIASTKFLPNTLRCPARPQVINQMNVRAAVPMIVTLSKVTLVEIEQVPLRVVWAKENVARQEPALLENGVNLISRLFGPRLQCTNAVGREGCKVLV
jgi:hypothetical protein